MRPFNPYILVCESPPPALEMLHRSASDHAARLALTPSLFLLRSCPMKSMRTARACERPKWRVLKAAGVVVLSGLSQPSRATLPNSRHPSRAPTTASTCPGRRPPSLPERSKSAELTAAALLRCRPPRSVANYTGGSRHHLAAARLHPERATQRRYFAEHRYGPELGRLDADRRKERMQFDLAWVRPAMGVEEAGRGTAVAGASKRPAAAPVNEEEQATLTRAAQPPAKKARTSTILQALDDDPGASPIQRPFPPLPHFSPDR